MQEPGTAAHLVFVPDHVAPRFFLWGAGAAGSPLAVHGAPARFPLVDQALVAREIEGLSVPLLQALPRLAALTAAETDRAPASLAAWSLAAKLALDLVGRERFVPRIVRANGATEARFAVALALPEDAERVAALARTFPLAAHAVPLRSAGPKQGGRRSARSRGAGRRGRDGQGLQARAPVTTGAPAGSPPTRVQPPNVPAPAQAPHTQAPHIWAPEALLRAFLDAAADALVRVAVALGSLSDRRMPEHIPWERRFLIALAGMDPAFGPDGFQERTLVRDLDAWSRPALGVERDAPRACFRLDLPGAEAGDASGTDGPARAGSSAAVDALAGASSRPGDFRAGDSRTGDSRTGSSRPGAASRADAASSRGAAEADAFPLRFFLQAADDPSLLVPSAEVFRGHGQSLRRLGHTFHAAEEHLLRALGAAARLFPPIARGLREARPESVRLDAAEAWAFLTEAAPAFAEAGLGVILPAELTRSGQRRLRLRMHVGGEVQASASAGTVAGASGLSLDEVMNFRWEAAIAGEALTARDLEALAALKAPLVRFRGQWVAVDPKELEEVRRLVAGGGGTLAAHEALAAALGQSVRRTDIGVEVDVLAEGRLGNALTRLRAGAEGAAAAGPAVPRGFRGELRPYQARGLSWLASMAELGLGACLADDMGLGKTIQLLAFLLHRSETAPGELRPALLVCPTSVIGNWEREIARFAPTLPVVRHYGPDRAKTAAELAAAPGGAVVITSYGLLRRDAALLGEVRWSVAALDEAQNIKNSASGTARAARGLRAAFRVALTGTPVENRLAELWSISEFLNPRLLGPLETFRREVAVPIERYGAEAAAARLARVIRPFLLRRLKSDPAVIRDLPDKQEMKVVCTLTREQASLYRAAVDETMRRIESSEGIQRRGLVLSLITSLKQICNHPAHYLGEAGPLDGRSGKLERLHEMLEESVDSGDRALVFTQYREMGDRLVAALEKAFGGEVPFLHGGVARAARDAMVRRFQEDPRGPRIFVLSVKAGGTGLNLTAANHVFHFDRWWNPAVEDQATDRAYRIGQTQAVQVHKLLTAGTIEEKIDELLEKKRGLAERVVGEGEQWITELDDGALRELFALAPDAVVAGDEADRDEAERDEAGGEADGEAGGEEGGEAGREEGRGGEAEHGEASRGDDRAAGATPAPRRRAAKRTGAAKPARATERG